MLASMDGIRHAQRWRVAPWTVGSAEGGVRRQVLGDVTNVIESQSAGNSCTSKEFHGGTGRWSPRAARSTQADASGPTSDEFAADEWEEEDQGA